MKNNLKNILITGVCGGMGYATAKYLNEKGHNIYGIDIMDNIDLPIHYYKANLCDKCEIQDLFKIINEEINHLDVIVHFAGHYTMNSLVEVSEEQLIKIFDINVFSIYRVNKIFLPLLRKKSRIIMTSSELAPLDPLPFTGLYAITKSTIEKYADSLRMELNLLGINVSVIRPGAVNTNMISASTDALEKLCNDTKLYQYNTARFRKIVDSVETKKIEPIKIAKITEKIINSRKAKYTYNINRNFLLRFLSFLPKNLQVKLVSKILKCNHSNVNKVDK